MTISTVLLDLFHAVTRTTIEADEQVSADAAQLRAIHRHLELAGVPDGGTGAFRVLWLVERYQLLRHKLDALGIFFDEERAVADGLGKTASAFGEELFEIYDLLHEFGMEREVASVRTLIEVNREFADAISVLPGTTRRDAIASAGRAIADLRQLHRALGNAGVSEDLEGMHRLVGMRDGTTEVIKALSKQLHKAEDERDQLREQLAQIRSSRESGE